MTVAQIYICKDGVVHFHHHENEQISYVLEGVLKFEIGGIEVIVRQGEMIHIPPDVPHRVIEIFATVLADRLIGRDECLRKS